MSTKTKEDSRENADASLKRWISDEITRQLRELKEQLNREFTEDLQVLEQKITENVGRLMMAKISSEVKKKAKTAVSRVVDDVKREVSEELDRKIESSNNQLIVANDRQLEVVRKNTRELVLAVGQQVQKQVYSTIIGEINEKIVPKVNGMVQWVNYNMQDGGEIIDQYRRAVETQSNPQGVKLLTDGKDSRVISAHVRTFFSEDE